MTARRLLAHWPLAIIFAAYLALALTYSLASPLYEPTDEIRHFRYVRHIVVYHALPVQSAEGPRAQSHHPPLYYALGALASWWVEVEQDVYYEPLANPHWDNQYWEVSGDNKNQYLHGIDERFPFRGVTLAVYVVRWMTVLIGAGAVWITHRIGYDLFPDQPALAIGAASLVAFNPQFIYLSGAVNNDILATLCSAAVLWMCIRLVRDGPNWRTDVALGILYGLALLTKFNLLALLALIELAYVLALWRRRVEERGDWRALLRANAIVLGLAILIAGWWFGRNQVLYGDPTGMSKVNELWAGRPASEGLWAIRQSLPYLWSSLWGRFGYGQVPLYRPVYRGLLAFCVLALAGHLVPRRKRLPSAALLLLSGTVLIFVAVVLYYIAIQPAGAMGRFLFPALPALAVLLIAGLSRFLPARSSWMVGGVVSVAMAALSVYALVGVLTPAFGRPRSLGSAEVEAVPNPTGVELGLSAGSGQNNVVRLLGYRVTPTTVRPGEVVEVILYWQPLARTGQSYAVFVHLLSDAGTMIAQRDTYPGLGKYLTTVWEPGVAFADTYRVRVPETAYAPDQGYIQVGLYLPDGPRLTMPDGRDALRLATVSVLPKPGEFPNALDVSFDGKIALIGYELDRRATRPGETIHLTLYWQAVAPMEENYSVFAHVLGVENQVWGGDDGWPVGGASPTKLWQPGQVFEDVRDLTIGLTTLPGFYDIEIGIHISGDRLPIVAEDGHHLGDRVLLSQIVRVTEGGSADEE